MTKFQTRTSTQCQMVKSFDGLESPWSAPRANNPGTSCQHITKKVNTEIKESEPSSRRQKRHANKTSKKPSATMTGQWETARTVVFENGTEKRAKQHHHRTLKELNIAKYNVRTLHTTHTENKNINGNNNKNNSAKIYQLITGCKNFKIKICAIKEHRERQR